MFQSRNKMLFSTMSKSALSRTGTETSPLSEAMRRSLSTYQYILPVVPAQRHEAQKYRSTVHDTTTLDIIQGAGCARTTAMRQSTLGNMQLPLTLCVQLFEPFPLYSSSSKGFDYCCRHWCISGRSFGSSDPVHGNNKMSSSTSETGTDLRGEDGGGRKTGG